MFGSTCSRGKDKFLTVAWSEIRRRFVIRLVHVIIDYEPWTSFSKIFPSKMDAQRNTDILFYLNHHTIDPSSTTLKTPRVRTQNRADVCSSVLSCAHPPKKIWTTKCIIATESIDSLGFVGPWFRAHFRHCEERLPLKLSQSSDPIPFFHSLSQNRIILFFVEVIWHIPQSMVVLSDLRSEDVCVKC